MALQIYDSRDCYFFGIHLSLLPVSFKLALGMDTSPGLWPELCFFFFLLCFNQTTDTLIFFSIFRCNYLSQLPGKKLYVSLFFSPFSPQQVVEAYAMDCSVVFVRMEMIIFYSLQKDRWELNLSHFFQTF